MIEYRVAMNKFVHDELWAIIDLLNLPVVCIRKSSYAGYELVLSWAEWDGEAFSGYKCVTVIFGTPKRGHYLYSKHKFPQAERPFDYWEITL